MLIKKPKNFENFKNQRFITTDNSDQWNLEGKITNLNSSVHADINSPSKNKNRTPQKKAITKDDFSKKKEGGGMFNLGTELDKFFDSKLTSSVITPIKEPKWPTIEESILESELLKENKNLSETEKLATSLKSFESNLQMAGKSDLVKIYMKSLEIKNGAKKKLNSFLKAKK